jgi:hypothetical protein
MSREAKTKGYWAGCSLQDEEFCRVECGGRRVVSVVLTLSAVLVATAAVVALLAWPASKFRLQKGEIRADMARANTYAAQCGPILATEPLPI